MAAIPSKLTYFLSPNQDFPPDGLIALGSIIVSPKSPEKSLNRGDDQRVAIPTNELQQSFKHNWEDTITSTRDNKFTVWTSFLQMVLGIGVDGSVGSKQGRMDVYRFHQLETKYFQPSVAYIEESLKKEGVEAYILATRSKKPIYMVTGVKIARGASVTSNRVKEYQGMVKVGLDATPLTGVPVSAGPQIETSKTKEREVTFDNSSDFVFAYCLVKIKLEDGIFKKQVDFTKGALFTTDEGGASNEDLVTGNWSVEDLDATSEELHGSNIVPESHEDGENDIVIVKP